jgi:hypothetical protein
MPRPESSAADIPLQDNDGISSTSFYNPAAMHSPTSGALDTEAEVNLQNAASEDPEDGVGGCTPVLPTIGAEEEVVQVGASPLATLEPLLSALPDAGQIGAVDDNAV